MEWDYTRTNRSERDIHSQPGVSMTSLPSGWDTADMEILTTTAREYLATIISNRERNKQQRKIAKSENASKNKKDKKKTTANPKKYQDCPPPNLGPHQKEILKEIK
eukprot:5359428-Ditylum_brightwellii.AAC.2